MRVLVEVTMMVELPDSVTDLDLAAYPSAILVEVPGKVEYQDHAVTRIVTPADAVCDFCSDPEPVFTYPATNFTLDMLDIPGLAEQGSEGSWAACYGCSRLVEEGKDLALAMRAVSEHPVYRRMPARDRNEMVDTLRVIHDQFRSHRNGPRQPITGGVNG